MSDGIGRERLLAALRMDDATKAFVHDLAYQQEHNLRRTLRPHAEAGFTRESDQADNETRRQLDLVLWRLTLYEIGKQLDIFTPQDTLPAERSDLEKLFQSGAMLRYANVYLYFGIRFLAGRIAAPEWFGEGVHPETKRITNQQELALVVPPTIKDEPRVQEYAASFLQYQRSDETREALRFLDDFISSREEPDWLERWLRGLRPETDETTAERFAAISQGLTEWALAKSDFYRRLEPAEPDAARNPEMSPEGIERPAGGWAVTNPVAGRLGLSDIYWIARLLRAEVSANAVVRYTRDSWLELLAFHAGLRGNSKLESDLRMAEEVLRSVFDLTCDLIQNAVEITEDRERKWFEPELFTALPDDAARWRETFDEELREIDSQRQRRRYRDPSAGEGNNPPPPPTPRPRNREGWSERIKTGKHPRNLIGLAFSGGGIRSATFNLGVLQGLQELDLLLYVDYLSTVSGGGFIGSWLAANVQRTTHWLGRLTNWDDSVAHLRRFSNYLAPSTGVLSADTWTMWAIWARNAFLIQLTGATWLAALLLTALAGQTLFVNVGELPAVAFRVVPYSGVLAALMGALVVSSLIGNLPGKGASKGKLAFSATWVRRVAVLPAWISSFLIAGLLWADARGKSALVIDAISKDSSIASLSSYSGILLHWWKLWWPILGSVGFALLIIAWRTMSRRRWHALWISPLSTLALYLQLCAIMLLFRHWSADSQLFGWYAFVFGPTMVLAANTLSVVLFIGLCGRNSAEWIREWWTRFGTWLGIYGVVYLAVAMSAVLGPLWILSLLDMHWSITGATVAGWIGTVVSGLFAGNSSKTTGADTQTKSPKLELLARAAGLLFIIGAVFMVATTVYALLVNIGTDDAVWSKTYWSALEHIPLMTILAALAVALFCGLLFSWFFEINIFGLSQFYRNRLVRCYLGATRWNPGLRKPQPFTGFDGYDDMPLSDLSVNFRGPFPILNCALNLGGSSDLSLHTRHSASFTLTPLRCGSDRRRVGFAPTKDGDRAFADGVKLGQAVAISGAAASPNMGYNTSPLVAFLLTMFNVRLGWWFPNPGQRRWHLRGMRFSLYYMLKELFGLADETNLFVNVSDGGHFENLGIYELVKRRCKVIIAADAECDEFLQFGSLGNLVRICETDFGAKIEIDVNSIRRQKDGHSLAHCTVGKITYSNGSLGYLIYLKSSVTADEDVGVTQYRSEHPSFPHESTADQFFSESQFEAYRRLGYHVVHHALRGIQPGSYPVTIAEKLFDVWTPGGATSEAFVRHARTLDEIWERFRQSGDLSRLLTEFLGNVPPGNVVPTHEEVCACLEITQLMENVFLDLRLDDFWDHPDNRGWAMLFMGWARSPIFRAVWTQTRRTFGIRFEYFCEERLGLDRDRPIARV